MKHFFKISFVAVITMTIVIESGCKKLLVEKPRAGITQDFFATPDGLEGGVASGYSEQRNLWGTENFMNIFCGGTDEVLAGGSNNNKHWFTYDATLNSKINEMGAAWGIWYQTINTENGVLKFAANVSMDDSRRKYLIAQAKFLRAFCYFHLVETFGNVPLHTDFITDASSADSRAPIADVYKLIIKDLTEAAVDLPNQPLANTGKPAFKATALYLLAKTYLTRGWSTAADPADFTNAYTTAMSVINNKDTYGLDLWPYFGSVNLKANDYGKETLMVIDHNSDTKFGEYTLNQAASGNKENKSNFYFRPNYPTVNANYPAAGGATSVCVRDINNGRPFIRIRPNYTYVTAAFPIANRVNDCRFERTFQTVWMSNVSGATTPRGTLVPGTDTAIWMPERLVTPAERAAFKGVIFEPPVTGATVPYTAVVYPSMRKYDDSTRAYLNDASTRPFAMFKFSELYLIAAEAAFKGGGTMQQAADAINVLRQRAAYRPTNTPAQNAAAVIAQKILASDVTIDLILDERARELYGEVMRWWDLARTHTLVSRVQLYNAEGGPNIKSYHVLKPIPQSQIDLVTEGSCIGNTCWQNPGYF